MKRSVEKISKMALCLVGTFTLMLSLNISAQVTIDERIEHIENELQKASHSRDFYCADHKRRH